MEQIKITFLLNSEGLIERVSGFDEIKSLSYLRRLRMFQAIRTKVEKEILLLMIRAKGLEVE